LYIIPTLNHQLINTNLTYSGISSPCNDGDGFFLAFVTLAEFKNVVFMALIKTRSRPGFLSSVVCAGAGAAACRRETPPLTFCAGRRSIKRQT
ncbi:hypothetical protein, partial [Klebsiella pneumoniae]